MSESNGLILNVDWREIALNSDEAVDGITSAAEALIEVLDAKADAEYPKNGFTYNYEYDILPDGEWGPTVVIWPTSTIAGDNDTIDSVAASVGLTRKG